MSMGELALDKVAAQPPEANQPVLVHSCRRLGHSANPPGFQLLFADWLRPLVLPLSAGASVLRQQNWRPGSRHGSPGRWETQALRHLEALCLRLEPTRRSDDVRAVRRRPNRSVNLPQLRNRASDRVPVPIPAVLHQLVANGDSIVNHEDAVKRLRALRDEVATLPPSTSSAEFNSWEPRTRSALARALGEKHYITQRFIKTSGPRLRMPLETPSHSLVHFGALSRKLKAF